jgi:hypothetical protein
VNRLFVLLQTLACTTCLNLVATGLLDKPYKAEVEVEVKDGVRVSFCIECFSVLREAMPEEYGDESKVKRLRSAVSSPSQQTVKEQANNEMDCCTAQLYVRVVNGFRVGVVNGFCVVRLLCVGT